MMDAWKKRPGEELDNAQVPRRQRNTSEIEGVKKKTKDFVKEETTLVREIGLGYSLLAGAEAMERCLKMLHGKRGEFFFI